MFELLAIFPLDLWFPTTVYLIRAKGKEIPVELTHNISEHKKCMKQISSLGRSFRIFQLLIIEKLSIWFRH